MANLQTSGPISLGDIKTLFGGPTSPQLSSYYRGGSYIPSTKTVPITVREPTTGEYFDDANTYTGPWGWTVVPASDSNKLSVFWNNVAVYRGTTTTLTTVTTGGYTYYRGSLRRQLVGGSYSFAADLYGVYRTYPSTTTVTINTGIPASGQVSLSEFYGAEKP